MEEERGYFKKGCPVPAYSSKVSPNTHTLIDREHPILNDMECTLIFGKCIKKLVISGCTKEKITLLLYFISVISYLDDLQYYNYT